MHKSIIALLAAPALLLASCSPQGWSIKGDIAGAPDTQIAIEAYNAGRWYVLDSLSTDSKGHFAYTAGEPMPATDILRVTLPGKGSICFPVADKDAVTLSAEAASFGLGHRLGGTPLAEKISQIDSTVAATADPAALQRKLVEYITADTTGIVAYYAVGKAVGNKPVFDPNTAAGNRIYGAAAQVYAHYQPADPRGEALKQAYFAGRRQLGKATGEATETVVELPETGVIDIERYDDRGTRHSLAELAQQGKVILLSFTSYGLESSPAYNALLNQLYTLYKKRGLEIYQIAFDGDEVEWKEAARNLPWITVWNSPSDGARVMIDYNVGALPMTYVINRQGEVSDRVVDPADMQKTLAKYF